MNGAEIRNLAIGIATRQLVKAEVQYSKTSSRRAHRRVVDLVQSLTIMTTKRASIAREERGG